MADIAMVDLCECALSWWKRTCFFLQHSGTFRLDGLPQTFQMRSIPFTVSPFFRYSARMTPLASPKRETITLPADGTDLNFWGGRRVVCTTLIAPWALVESGEPMLRPWSQNVREISQDLLKEGQVCGRHDVSLAFGFNSQHSRDLPT